MTEPDATLKTMRNVTKNYLKHFIQISHQFLAGHSFILDTYIELFIVCNDPVINKVKDSRKKLDKFNLLLENFRTAILKIENIETIKTIILTILTKITEFINDLNDLLLTIDSKLINTKHYIFNYTNISINSLQIFHHLEDFLLKNQLLSLKSAQLLDVYTVLNSHVSNLDFIKIKLSVLGVCSRPSFNPYVEAHSKDSNLKYSYFKRRFKIRDYNYPEIDYTDKVTCLCEQFKQVLLNVSKLAQKVNIGVPSKSYTINENEKVDSMEKLNLKVNDLLKSIDFENKFGQISVDLMFGNLKNELVNLSELTSSRLVNSTLLENLKLIKDHLQKLNFFLNNDFSLSKISLNLEEFALFNGEMVLCFADVQGLSLR